jgi:hypothetical protein
VRDQRLDVPALVRLVRPVEGALRIDHIRHRTSIAPGGTVIR